MKLMSIAIFAVLVSAPAIAHEETAKVPPSKKSQPSTVSPPKQLQVNTKRASTAQHSGGTDANGCHTNHSTGEYHCHKPK